MKRPSTEGASAPPMDAKRPKEDVEHTVLMKVLQPAVPPETKLAIATITDYLEDEVTRIIANHPTKGFENALQFLAKGWRRSEEGGVVPSTWSGIQPLQEAVLTTALTQLISASSEDKIKALASLLDSPVPAKLLNELLIGASEDDAVPFQLVRSVAQQLKGRHLNDAKSSDFAKLLRVLKASKTYVNVLVASPCLEEFFHPPFEPKFFWRNKKKEIIAKQKPGHMLQSRTLLGWALSPTALDTMTMPPSKAHLAEAGAQEWQDLYRATRQRVESLQRSTQQKLTFVQGQAAELTDILIRAGDAPRTAVLKWIGAMLTACEPRGKQGHVAPSGFNFWPNQGHHLIDVMNQEQSPAFEKSLKNLLLLQVLHAKLHGFPTSGCALNMMTVLLHLLKPLKLEQAASFSPWYPLRKDTEELMGTWIKEARFGENDLVDAAREIASRDPDFNVHPLEKSLFKTQIFWLACKGIGTFLLPVIKEAFHTMQGIAGVFVQKDREIADCAWREYLLAETSLKEPAFLERLGHMVNLTFRFLQHVAAGGQEALPPPTPGPTWHALPSTILENIIDLLDLYRDRQQRVNMPTGLYAHLEPDPILTVFCVVMASDDHVRDPSLRGRTVKLLHRLCTAFPAWQEKLNQPPLSNHLIPCLINVFIAVEKAIISYYDLSYRYKYELRIPVMDLFELALKNEGHRKVLDAFVRGPGSDRFLKLLTQLINDSNSQTEEAIRTIKEYHEKKRSGEDPDAPAPVRPAPSGAAGSGGGQHDEEVLDDDQSEGGEDIYRRSRMNYKEHAKKYFGLASKTWKTLWLVCKHCAPVIVDGRTTLEQLLHTSLDAQLHFLVGPEMKNLKATEQEYDELGFNGKELVRQIAECYLFLARSNREEVCRIMAKDERYYSTTTFSKAVNFIRKYRLLNDEETKEFDSFVKETAERVSQQRAAFDEADIPAEYLCEMMADIMSDPVQFPQSKKIVDRSTAVRQIMSSDRDPYANTPVKVEELIPLPELKAEIHRFAKDNGITLEGGNMFD